MKAIDVYNAVVEWGHVHTFLAGIAVGVVFMLALKVL